MKAAVLACLGWLCLGAQAPQVQEGDLVFQTSRSAQSLAIQRATASPYSHMGIVLFRQGKPQVFEAIGTVRYTPLDAWIRRGQDQQIVVKRLRGGLDVGRVRKLRELARTFEGKPYDSTFEWSDRRIYCSELVWKLYKQSMDVEIGELQRLKEFQLQDPAVRAKLRERYGAAIPLEEPVISPAAMFESPLLETVGPEIP